MLIILRGNSGSGKTTTAKLLRQTLRDRGSEAKIAVVEQDYQRQIILQEDEMVGDDNIDLIEQTVRFALKRGYIVVLEGILHTDRYGDMLKRLIKVSDKAYVYYYQLPFEETLKRHSHKANSHEYGEKEMSVWYREHDVLGLKGEQIFTKELSQDEIIDRILSDTGI